MAVRAVSESKTVKNLFESEAILDMPRFHTRLKILIKLYIAEKLKHRVMAGPQTG